MCVYMYCSSSHRHLCTSDLICLLIAYHKKISCMGFASTIEVLVISDMVVYD